MRGVGSLCLLLAGSLSVGCYSTRSVHGPEMSRIARGARVVYTTDGMRARVDPNSRVRFYRADGSVTPWIKAGDLSVSDDGVMLGTTQAGIDGLRWSDIDFAEVNNLSGGYTLVVVAGSALIVALVIAAAKGGGDAPDCSGVSCGGIYHVGPTYVPVGPIGPTPPSRGIDGPRRSGRTRGYALARPGFEQPRAEGARELFNYNQRRRAGMKFNTALTVDGDLDGPGEWYESLYGGVRFVDMFELGGGVRRQHTVVQGESPLAGDSLFYPFGRAGLHMELDAGQRVAVPTFVEYGLTGRDSYMLRIGWGVRIRVTDEVYFGLFPVNPVLTRDALGNQSWSYPSGIELGSTF